jgi:hypothetical protein
VDFIRTDMAIPVIIFSSIFTKRCVFVTHHLMPDRTSWFEWGDRLQFCLPQGLIFLLITFWWNLIGFNTHYGQLIYYETERETWVLQQNALIGITDTAIYATYAFSQSILYRFSDARRRSQNPKFSAGIFVNIFVTLRYWPSKY